MPITEFQRTVLLLLKEHRNPNSYVAGGVAILRSAASTRHSNDIDFFHDTDEAIIIGAKADRELLREHGYEVRTIIEQPGFIRAVISKVRESLKLEWVRDTAFRFFPTIEDFDLGYRLHDIDLAVNKCLALANRHEVRDILDLMQLHKTTLSISGACWAACGKDPGFTPQLLLDLIRRHSIIRPEQLASESLTAPISPTELKSEWWALLEEATHNLEAFLAADLGCLYLDSTGEPVHFPMPQDTAKYRRHFGSPGGSWPRVVA